jgi:hypothetical protein
MPLRLGPNQLGHSEVAADVPAFESGAGAAATEFSETPGTESAAPGVFSPPDGSLADGAVVVLGGVAGREQANTVNNKIGRVNRIESLLIARLAESTWDRTIVIPHACLRGSHGEGCRIRSLICRVVFF